MPTQCPNCKAVNRDVARFCDECGAALRAGQAMPPVAVPGEETVGDAAAAPTRHRDAGLRASGSTAHATRAVPADAVAMRAPRVAPGRPTRYWRRLYGPGVLLLFVAATVFRLVDAADLGAALVFGATLAIAGAAIAAPLALRASCKGIVTHMRQWAPLETDPKPGTAQTWLFDLRFTDDQWRPLRDRHGFELPIIEVEFRSDRVHGPALEEGSQVVLRAGWHRDRLKARTIWNLTANAEPLGLGALADFFGRVAGLQSRHASDVRYPGEKQLEVWSFRLQPTDPDFEQLQRDAQGNLLRPWPVEVRAQTVGGPLGEGDKVEVRGHLVRGTIYSKDVRNHSAGGAQLIVKDWAGVP